MKASRQWLYYTVIRLALFAVTLAVLLMLNVNSYLATVVAAIVGLCLSYLFLHKRREALARSLHDIRTAEHQPVQRDEDNDIENAALDRLDHDKHDHDELDHDKLNHDKHAGES